MTALKSIAVAISGGGSNMMAIHRAILLGKISATIKLVVTDNENAAGLPMPNSIISKFCICPIKL